MLILIQDLHVRIINAATGELLRELTIDPARNYQPATGSGAARGCRPGRSAQSRITSSWRMTTG